LTAPAGWMTCLGGMSSFLQRLQQLRRRRGVLSVNQGLPLETAGRLVSVAFFLLCLWPLYRILDWLHVESKAVALSFVVFTPLYVFWSRSFMIESTALFFALLYVTEVYRIVRKPRQGIMEYVGLFVVGTLAALVKATTFLPLFLVVCAVLAYRLYRDYSDRPEVAKLGMLLAVQIAIFVALLAWVRHTDALKSLIPIGAMLTSEHLRAWNFGTLSQRLDPYVWFRLGNNLADIYFPFPRTLAWLKGLGCIFLAALFAYCLKCCSSLRRMQVAGLLALFALPFLIFFNLHRIHNYYQNANAVFLSLAMGVALIGALETASPTRRVMLKTFYWLVVLTFTMSSMWYFNFKSSHYSRYMDLASYLHQHTPINSVIVFSGQSWSPEIPYQAKRMALMLPDEFPSDVLESGLRKTIEAGEKVSAYVRCGSGALDGMVGKYFNIARAPESDIAGCKVYLFDDR
ncbi:MAG: hypothetical protein ACKN9T_18220, partial [Candidatus Methylumidiphilus sp.]